MKHLTLETARALKDAGFPQSTYFFWYPKDHENGGFIEPGQYHVLPFGGYYDEICACPTSDELLESLPPTAEAEGVGMDKGYIVTMALRLSPALYQSKWYAFYETPDHRQRGERMEGDTPAEALAALFLALKAKEQEQTP